MIVAYWIVAGLAALVFAAAGIMKLVRPKDALAASGLKWVEDFSGGSVKLIGLAEILGAVGLIAPIATQIAPVLAPIAALALAVLMVGATVVHVRRKEAPVSAALLVLAVVAAILGFLIVL